MASAAARAGAAGGRIRYRHPQLAIARFVGRRATRAGALWGLAFGAYVYSTAVGYDTVAPTAAKRYEILSGFAHNTGLKALLGDTHRITTRAGFTDWRVIGVAAMVGSIWGLLTATRSLRGEEAAGRWELFLAGQATGRRAAGNALAGLGAGVLAMYLAVGLLTIVVGARPGVGIGPGPSMLFAVAVTAGAAEFAAIGALASQLMPTRARAAGLAAVVFGVAFMLRALGDSAASAHWVVYLSPLGWVAQLRPLTGAHAVWLLPIAGLIAACATATVLLADRDLGASVLADKDTARPRTALLGSPLLIALRLSFASVAGWVLAAVLAGMLYGSLAKSAGQAFTSSGVMRKLTGSLSHEAVRHMQQTGARLYAGVIFLLLMALIMAYVASAMGRLREDEAEGYLDNLVVRRVSRQRWLAGRTGLILAALLIASIGAAAGFWAGAASQHAGLTFHELLLAGLAGAAPATLLLGIGVCTLGFAPRLTSIVCWGTLTWAFLLDMLGSAIKINHWVMDTSLLYHPALAPAVNPNWRIAGIYLAIGCAGALAGGWRFTQRDLQSN